MFERLREAVRGRGRCEGGFWGFVVWLGSWVLFLPSADYQSVVKQWGTAFRYINRPLLARLVLSMTFFLDGFTSARCRLSHGYFVLVIENM